MSRPTFPVISNAALEAAELLLKVLLILDGDKAPASVPPDRPYGHTRQALRVLLAESLGTDMGEEVYDSAITDGMTITEALTQALLERGDGWPYTFVDEGMGYVTVLDRGGNPQEYSITRADAYARYAPNRARERASMSIVVDTLLGATRSSSTRRSTSTTSPSSRSQESEKSC